MTGQNNPLTENITMPKLKFVQLKSKCSFNYNQYLEGRHADCRIYTAEKEFQAHRLLLSITSQRFKRIFENQSVHDVAFADVYGKDLQDALTLCYTGSVEMVQPQSPTFQRLVEFLQLGEKSCSVLRKAGIETEELMDEEKENDRIEEASNQSTSKSKVQSTRKRRSERAAKPLTEKKNAGCRRSARVVGTKKAAQTTVECPICSEKCNETLLYAHIDRVHLAINRRNSLT